ncbi:MAG TPA: zf-HC2 domain-containing protein [Pyrinomonadaceae bacterium]|nr:zf-HC2 domain-containing protein [Pyrinomonadaceae bacterium]
MRQETNNEIDLLLRRLGRRQEMPVSDSDHLDADELSAFAENAVPAAARARYTEHLADCAKCREIVVQLGGSIAVVAARDTVTVPAPSALRKFLASFFSPMVLRYAVPALGLIVVVAIGFVVLYSTRSRMSVAQLEPQAQRPPVSAEAQQSPSSDLYDATSKSASPQAARQSTNEKPLAAAAEPPPPSAPASGDIAAAKTDAPAPKPAEQAAANAAPERAEPTPAPSPTVDEMRVDVQARRNEQGGTGQARDLAKQKTAESFQDQDKKARASEAERQKAQQPAAGAASAQGAGSRTFGMTRKEEKDSDGGEIRSVAGRRFRKQNGIWVDTAYSSGGTRANMARGSERYRALVADEPEIKKIADELGGPIIVVWKGRTYEIR